SELKALGYECKIESFLCIKPTQKVNLSNWESLLKYLSKTDSIVPLYFQYKNNRVGIEYFMQSLKYSYLDVLKLQSKFLKNTLSFLMMARVNALTAKNKNN